MLLAIDIGNTQSEVGLFEGPRLLRSWRMSSRRDMTADEARVLLAGFLAEEGSRPVDAIVGSVVPPLTGAIIEALRGLGLEDPLEVLPGIKTGIRIRMDNPQEVGADRILNAVAAYERHPCPAVIVDFGTATTLDVVTENGEYVGGIISPGPRLGAEALSVRAARLPRVDLSLPPRVIGRNSVDAMRSGVLFGHAAMIDGLVRRIEAELERETTIIVTGGLASVIAPLIERVGIRDPHLTLEGLRLLYERNRPR